jgi:hypothetical protein
MEESWEELYQDNPERFWQEQYKEMKELIRRNNVLYDLGLELNITDWKELRNGKVIVIKTRNDTYTFRTYRDLQYFVMGMNFILLHRGEER